jgi:superfamily I DNA and RNA helicase
MEIDNPKNISFLQDEEKIEYILKNAYLITTQYRHILVDEAQDLPGNVRNLTCGSSKTRFRW